MKRLLWLAILLSSSAFGGDWKSFCKDVPVWPKGSDVPADEKYKDLANPVDGVFAKAKWDLMKKEDNKEQWVIIDARSKKDRSVGKVPKSALITADYNDATKNQFNEKFLVKKVNRVLKTKHKSLADLKDVNFIVFCNGKKCHRSSFGTCKLREMGIARDKLNIMLGGFPEWKDRGFPVR